MNLFLSSVLLLSLWYAVTTTAFSTPGQNLLHGTLSSDGKPPNKTDFSLLDPHANSIKISPQRPFIIPNVFVDSKENPPNPEHTLVPACTYSPTFGPDNEMLKIDGKRVCYRNGLLDPLTGKWYANDGPPLPFSYHEDHLLSRNGLASKYSMLVDTGGNLWRGNKELEEMGYFRSKVELELENTTDSLERHNATGTDQEPWLGPMEMTAHLGYTSKPLYKDLLFSDDERWLVYRDKLARYKARFGHTNVPSAWEEDRNLGLWVHDQRVSYNRYVKNQYYVFELYPNGTLGERNNMISPWRIQQLYDLGFIFKLVLTWEERYKQLKTFVEREGHARVPPEYNYDNELNDAMPVSGKGLNQWCMTQRTEYRRFKVGKDSALNQTRIDMLNEVGFEWDINEGIWETRRKELEEYRAKNGHIRVRRRHEPSLAAFVKIQRAQHRIYLERPWESSLKPHQIEMLDEVGMDWDVVETRWQEMFQQLEQFRERTGHCLVPKIYPENRSLGNWVRSLRSMKQDGSLSKDKEEQLKSIDFVFNVSAHLFENGMTKLRAYKEEYGDCLVPSKYEDKKLAWFVAYHRYERRARDRNLTSSTTDERIRRLDEIGFVWDTSTWEDNFERLREYFERHGNSNVPVKYTDTKLAGFVQFQRSAYQREDADKAAYLTPERVAKLESVNFIWNIRDWWWQQRYSELLEFRKQHGHCDTRRMNDRRLQLWVHAMRCKYKKYQAGQGGLKKEQVQLLEEVGVVWTPEEAVWEQRFSELLQFREKHGHCKVSRTSKSNLQLAYWVSCLRSRYKTAQAGKGHGTLTEERIRRLEEIGFIWDLKEAAWENRFSELIAFRNEHGHCNIPHIYKDNPSLGYWVNTVRASYKKFQSGNRRLVLTEERIKRLEKVGFQWTLMKKSKANKKAKEAKKGGPKGKSKKSLKKRKKSKRRKKTADVKST